MQRWLAWSKQVPGGLICHPVAVAALAISVLNDYVLKGLVPGPLTGKLSDAAGLVYFPLAIVAAIEVVAYATGRSRPVRRPVLLFSLLATAAVFSAIKIWPLATEAYNSVLGFGQWILSAGFVTDRPLVLTTGVTDPTDLLVLPALLVAYLSGTELAPASSAAWHRPSAAALALVFVAGVTNIANQPAMRSFSTDYVEELQLTSAAPAVTRHLSIDIANRDPQLADIHLVARSYTRGTDHGMATELDTEGVAVRLVPDDPSGEIGPSFQYDGPELDLTESCKNACREGVTVIVLLTDQTAASDGPITTNLEVSLFAGASEEGTGEVDIDLAITRLDEDDFVGTPSSVSAATSGALHIGADVPSYESAFEIRIDETALAKPYGYPLFGEIAVWHDNKTAVGHPNAHGTAFEFESPSLSPEAYQYSWADVGTGWLDEPDPPPTTVDLLPLCEAATDCTIRATLTSYYEEYLNDPERPGETGVLGSIDFDWHLEVRLFAFDGRDLPEGAITFASVD